MRSIVIHGHFYQPPRDDPWSGTIPSEASAAPYHDWNERIDRECYGPIGPSLPSLSFDFGPTLLAWMEQHSVETYAAVLAGDRASVTRHAGHGSALAMPYHHSILPLSSRRDKETEVRWGIADFRRRFGREPEGLWLPETAVDDETIDVLATEGIRFTILAPHQVEQAPSDGLPRWVTSVGGHRLAVFLYDGAMAQDVAFGSLARDPWLWIDRLTSGNGDGPRVVSLATDGETFGHHHRDGVVTLEKVLGALGARGDVQVENFAAVLARIPPQGDLRLVGPSSWSCPHGVERWRSDCGCRVHTEHATQQRWRAPLRNTLGWLAGELHGVFEREGSALFADPWGARDAYVSVLGSGTLDGAVAAFLAERMRTPVDRGVLERAYQLLELERHALRMFTSCGWFFDDIAGIESLMVLRSAARAIELSGADAPRLEAGLLEGLAGAPSNDPSVGSGRELYLHQVKAGIPRL